MTRSTCQFTSPLVTKTIDSILLVSCFLRCFTSSLISSRSMRLRLMTRYQAKELLKPILAYQLQFLRALVYLSMVCLFHMCHIPTTIRAIIKAAIYLSQLAPSSSHLTQPQFISKLKGLQSPFDSKITFIELQMFIRFQTLTTIKTSVHLSLLF